MCEIDGSDLELFASGVRNSVGFDWDPVSGVFFFTENGADRLGDNFPDDVLYRAPKKGRHFGYPCLHIEAMHPWLNCHLHCRTL